MYLCRVDIGKCEETLKEIEKFASLKQRFDCDVYLYGSFANREIHEGSDIDLIIVGDFKERFFERIGKILQLTDLPIEPLVYTRAEFDAMMKDNLFLKEVLKDAKKMV